LRGDVCMRRLLETVISKTKKYENLLNLCMNSD
jgi:hypothetical protein